MRKIFGITFASLLLIFNISLKAQSDVRVSALGLIFKSYGVGYEYVINDEMGTGVGINYSNSFFGIGNTGDRFSSLRIAPEFRFYFNPEDGADGFYFGGYLKYASVKWRGIQDNIPVQSVDSWGNTITTDVPVIYDLTFNGLAFGIQMGKKWVTNSGFFLETNFNFGRYLTGSTKYSNSSVQTYYDTRKSSSSAAAAMDIWYTFDWGFKLNVGWRFGG